MSSHNCPRIGRPWRGWFLALLFVLAFGGCGGGADSGGTGAPQSASASGPVTGFGSVIVDGVHFDDSIASVTDADGAVRSRDDLKLGMTTTIDGSVFMMDATGAQGTAASIQYDSAIVGPVDSLNGSGNSLVVLGQTVDVQPSTVFETGLNGGLAALTAGDLVEIYAFFDALNNRYAATRIERKSGVSAYRLRGIVGNLNTVARTFKFGTERISYAGVPASDVPTTLADGRFMRVQVQTVPTGGAWVATQLRDGVNRIVDRNDARIEGLISDFSSVTQFSVDGVSIDASHASVTGSVALGMAVRVAVAGTAGNGVLVARTVKSKTEADVVNEGFVLNGSISAIDIVNMNFVLRDVTVGYSGSVELRGGTISDLAVGKRVNVKGEVSADGTGLQAVRIQFLP